MEDAIQTMVKVFLKTSKGKENLGKKEFQSLVSNQLSNILTDTDSKEAIDNMGKGLDSDHDGKVGFEEYLKLVGYLACSLSEQRGAAKEEPAQNAAADQGTQSAPGKEEERPEANAESKEEAEPKAGEEAKAEATAEAKAEAQADAKVEVKAEAQAEGEVKPGVVKGDAEEAVVAAVEEAGKEAEKLEETVKPEESAEKAAAAVEEEEVEKKTEEKTS
ncbi:S100 calcium binding protein U [Menidia menidia]